MLSEMVLDDERFSQIAERAKAQITDMEPLWTDHNLHDPGITLLELFAWLKEMQQFHMDQITNAHLAAHLRLMGITPLKKQAAEAVVRMEGVKQLSFFPQGSRFFAGETCFEAVTPIQIGMEEIIRLSVRRKEETQADAGVSGIRDNSVPLRAQEQKIWEYDTPVSGDGKLHFAAFGAHPKEGDALWMEIGGALKPHVTYCLSIRISEEEAYRRNPIGEGDSFYPLAELTLRYRGAQGECAAEIVEDTTHGLLSSGRLRFRFEREMVRESSRRHDSPEQEMAPENGRYYLRMVLKWCEYDMPPVLAGISLKEQAVVQQRTYAEYYDGRLCGKKPIRICTYLAMTGEFLLFRREGDFFVPYDGIVEKRISDEAALFFFPKERETEDFDYRIICYEAGRGEELRIGQGLGTPDQTYEPKLADLCADGMCLMMETEKGSGRYRSAEHCDDLMRAGALDAVFAYEEESGRIRFGDCDHGIAPEGNILFAAARSSQGLDGNVKAGSISRFEDGERGIAVENRFPAAGGSAAETASQSRERFIGTSGPPARAVTDEDYEQIVLNTPGLLIESARVIPAAEGNMRGGAVREACVTLVVKPCQAEPQPRLSEAYRRNILRALEPKRMIGTRIALLSPEYFGISVFAELVTSGQEQTARSAAEETAAGYFRQIRAAFGVSVRVSAIYGMLNVLSVVSEISSLSLDAQGKDIRRSRSGDLILPPNGLAYLKECVLSISSEAGSCETHK